MRIGIDTTALPAQPLGAGVYILQLVRALAALDSEHELVIFVQRGRRDLFALPPAKNLEWVSVPDKSAARRLAWEQAVLPVLAQGARIDLLHSPHYTRPLVLPCKSVVTFHDMTFFLAPHLHTRAKRTFFPLAIRLSARLADQLVAVSENTRQDSIRILGISPEKISTTRLGVNASFRPITDQDELSQARRKYALPETFLLYLGAIEPRKNLPLLLRAYARLVMEGLAHDLVVVGSRGWMYEEVFLQVERLDLTQRVHFTGYLAAEELPSLYNLAEAFIYPSLYEGFGIPPLEAMACGVPVVTTASSAMIETIGDAGLLVPAGDEQALAEAMRNLLSNAELRTQLSTKGLQRAKQFTWEQTARETVRVYEQALSRR